MNVVVLKKIKMFLALVSAGLIIVPTPNKGVMDIPALIDGIRDQVESKGKANGKKGSSVKRMKLDRNQKRKTAYGLNPCSKQAIMDRKFTDKQTLNNMPEKAKKYIKNPNIHKHS